MIESAGRKHVLGRVFKYFFIVEGRLPKNFGPELEWDSQSRFFPSLCKFYCAPVGNNSLQSAARFMMVRR